VSPIPKERKYVPVRRACSRFLPVEANVLNLAENENQIQMKLLKKPFRD
jgi:hypothetical protein